MAISNAVIEGSAEMRPTLRTQARDQGMLLVIEAGDVQVSRCAGGHSWRKLPLLAALGGQAPLRRGLRAPLFPLNVR